MTETQAGTQPPERGFDDEYVRQRTLDPDMLVRDVGRTVAEAILTAYGPRIVERLVLDSETVTEALGEYVLAGLARAGYEVAFVARRKAAA